jgi:hypothetical protein
VGKPGVEGVGGISSYTCIRRGLEERRQLVMFEVYKEKVLSNVGEH